MYLVYICNTYIYDHFAVQQTLTQHCKSVKSNTFSSETLTSHTVHGIAKELDTTEAT